jgi:hypothetical protein
LVIAHPLRAAFFLLPFIESLEAKLLTWLDEDFMRRLKPVESLILTIRGGKVLIDAGPV